MLIGFIFTVIILFVLYGLIASTEKILTHRQEHVVLDERMIEHRSRL